MVFENEKKTISSNTIFLNNTTFLIMKYVLVLE